MLALTILLSLLAVVFIPTVIGLIIRRTLKDEAFIQMGLLASFILLLIIGLVFGVQAKERANVREGIRTLESVRRTIATAPKNQFENEGLISIVIQQNLWLDNMKFENNCYWTGDLSVDDSIENVKPLTLK